MNTKKTEEDQAILAAKAMVAKAAGAAPQEHSLARAHDDEGFNNIPRLDYPPSGAFDAEGHRPVLERSRKER